MGKQEKRGKPILDDQDRIKQVKKTAHFAGVLHIFVE
jgi:hypothetical protein